MKTNCFINIVAASSGLAAFAAVASAATNAFSVRETAAKDEPTLVAQLSPTAASDIVPANWVDIKEYTYDMRVSFSSAVKQLETKVDKQIDELNAKRAAMKSDTDTKAWDFAMREMKDARTYFQSTAAELNKATPETWNQLKEKVGQAWTRTQDAYDKVRASTTNMP